MTPAWLQQPWHSHDNHDNHNKCNNHDNHDYELHISDPFDDLDSDVHIVLDIDIDNGNWPPPSNHKNHNIHNNPWPCMFTMHGNHAWYQRTKQFHANFMQ